MAKPKAKRSELCDRICALCKVKRDIQRARVFTKRELILIEAILRCRSDELKGEARHGSS